MVLVIVLTEVELQQLEALWGKFQLMTGTWSDVTFPTSSDTSRIAHTRDELDELEAEPADPMETADVILLMTHHAHKHGYNLFKASLDKFEIVKQRKWGKPDERGVIRHVDD